MKTISLNINKQEYLKDLFEAIPSNVILYKTLPGIGATHLELSCERHSIIIEPHVPVIEGKMLKNKDIVLGVYNKTSKVDIYKYLSNPKILFKKILCTPESFITKVIPVMEDLGIDFYTNFFLLFDECDRVSKDVGYRKNISKPMLHFFKFLNKAFVSATALIPYDPRFEENGFEIVKITPSFDYRRHLELIISNNPKTALKDLIHRLVKTKDDSPIFIFFNSALGITSIISELKIENETSIFCGADAKESIKKGSKKNRYKICEVINSKTVSKFNFLTSRYYSAVDIDLPEGMMVHTIVLTDINAAVHTIIDPYSDLIQIPGRFRTSNETPNRLKSFTFISNVNADLPFKTTQEAKGYIDGCEDGYNNLITLRDTTQNKGFKELMQEAINSVFFSVYINEDGTKNYFMYDNYFYEENLKSYYSSTENLRNQFDHLPNEFTINFQEINYKAKSFYTNVNLYKTYRERILEVINLLEQINQEDKTLFIIQNDWKTEIEHIHTNYLELVQLYNLVGKDAIIKSCFTKNDIEMQILKYRQNVDGIRSKEIYNELNINLKLNLWYDQKALLNTMQTLYKKYNLPYTRALASLENFYRFDKKTVKGYPKIKLVEQKFKKDN